jgi:hypothetical protein
VIPFLVIRAIALLIDRTHKKWAWATSLLAAFAVGLYLFLYHRAPGGLTGGDLVGMVYGILGALLMLFAGSLSFLRRVPSWWWIGTRKAWLRGHIWLGLLAGPLILCHSAGRLGGPLELVLMIVVGLTLFTGIAGLLLQQFLPRLLTVRVPHEAPYEQIPYLCARLRQEADELLDRAQGDARIDENARVTLAKFYNESVRPFLGPAFDQASPLAKPMSAELVFADLLRRPEMAAISTALFLKSADGKWAVPKPGAAEDEPALGPVDWLEAYCDERRGYAEQERLHHWLHGWLLLHVPLSVVLLVLGVAHVVSALYY